MLRSHWDSDSGYGIVVLTKGSKDTFPHQCVSVYILTKLKSITMVYIKSPATEVMPPGPTTT